MGAYTNDFMMAVVIGSTAFIGLTPVLTGQITKSGLKRCRKKALVGLLALSVLFGILAILFAIGWLLGPETMVVTKTMVVRLVIELFAAEIAICEMIMFGFWFGLFGEIEPSKPVIKATRSKSSRKRALPQ